MKLRRALAVAAATAAIAPMALLAAPGAYATDSPSPSSSASATETATVSPPPSDTQSPTASDPGTPSGDPSQSVTTDPTATGSAPATATTEPTGSTSPSASTSVSPSPSSSAPEEDLCESADEESLGLSDDLTSGLSGLPETIVAGSGWTEFSFDVSNNGDEPIKKIKPLIGVAAFGWDEEDYSGEIVVQVFDKAAGSWHTLADAAGEGATFPAFDLGAGQSTSYPLRLSVSGKVPEAIGLTGGFAQYSDAEGCWMADDPNGWFYIFDILAAGSDAGDPQDAKPQGGMAELDEVNDVDATGSLAETGSSSALPMIGLAGGVAVVAGAGALFVVRRKKAGAQA
ncbi:LAETG motif-containing sortase-dependent surface protein [Streptomyces sp. NPDC047706]|uniref:LAETG motif-containing sortase-dependent surface protein n=1 Tax=Streptomyces sp. NPDC047706 TaxID=3365486 RepID=UPI0037118264